MEIDEAPERNREIDCRLVEPKKVVRVWLVYEYIKGKIRRQCTLPLLYGRKDAQPCSLCINNRGSFAKELMSEAGDG